MSRYFEEAEDGLLFSKIGFDRVDEFERTRLIFKSQFQNISDSDSFCIKYVDLFEYKTNSETNDAVNLLFFRFKIPEYDILRFETIHQGRVGTKEFKLRIKIINRRQVEINLKKSIGYRYLDIDGDSYFLSPPIAMLIEAWNVFQKKAEDASFRRNPEYQLAAYSELVAIYDLIKTEGNSLLDIYKVNVVNEVEYTLLGKEDGTWDVEPAFGKELEKFNKGLNQITESNTGYSNNVVFQDRKKKKKYNLYFAKAAEKSWKEFVEIKKLPPKERSERLKSGGFIEKFPPKLILGAIFSDRVEGFSLNSAATLARDNKATQSWNEGFDDLANRIYSVSGSVFNISLTPSHEIYDEIKECIQKLKIEEAEIVDEQKNITGSVHSEPIIGQVTVYVDSLKDNFNLSDLETLADRIEKSNKVEVEDFDLEFAKSQIKNAKDNKKHSLVWKGSNQQEFSIPTKSLELSVNDMVFENTINSTVSVKIVENAAVNRHETGSLVSKWYMEGVDESETFSTKAFNSEIKLRSYQAEGYAWLKGIATDARILKATGSRGALLADDMGLGKTIQIIRLLATVIDELQSNKPILIVGPVSLLKTSWEVDGLKKFFTKEFLNDNKVIFLSELREKISNKTIIKEILAFEEKLKSEEDFNFKSLKFSDEVNEFLISFNRALGSSIVMCSYETMRSRIFELATIDFSLVILDEAQKIKNASTGQSRAAKALKADMKVAMTGTPIENSIMDLWNICDFVVPGHMGTIKQFREKFHKRILNAAPGTAERKIIADELEADLSPIWLRRTKKEILKNGEIPAIIHYDSCRDEIGAIYNAHLVQMSSEQLIIFKTQVGYFNDSSKGQKLAAIRNMMEACYSPWWAKGLAADYVNIHELFKISPKLKCTFDILDQIARKGEKVLIFVNIKELQQELSWLIQQWYFYQYGKSVDCEFFNGDLTLQERAALLSRFQKSEAFKAVIISPRSGGAGLNLVQANHVIHYTREWNPAVERQATDRAHRLGQERVCHVYYPTSSLSNLGMLSAEEHLANILRDKREVIDDFTVSQGDMGQPEAQFDSYSFGTADTRITPEGIRTLGPYKFEKLVGAYYKSMGFSIEQVGKAGDKGCDIVCLSNEANVLVQVKFTEQSSPQGTAAINEIRGSKSYYEQKHGKKFNLVAVTNSFFSPSAHDLSFNGDRVTLISGPTLIEYVNANEVMMSHLRK